MNSITLKLSSIQIQEMEKHYQAYLLNAVPYSTFRAKKSGITITAYTSGKVLFQGLNADQEAQKWGKTSTVKAKPSTSQSSTTEQQLVNYLQKQTIIGNDEVGNGSYFGALTVCSVYLPLDQHALMKELGVKDSKLLTDQQIRIIAKDIVECVPYELTVCNPQEYNFMQRTQNANQIKVSLHNRTILGLMEKLNSEQKKSLDSVLIDQFTPESNYYRYLKKEASTYNGKIHFLKKAESLNLAVACASIIARAAFLKSLETLGKPYQQILPSGAGVNVDIIAAHIINDYGLKALGKTAKLHFANTEKAKKLASK